MTAVRQSKRTTFFDIQLPDGRRQQVAVPAGSDVKVGDVVRATGTHGTTRTGEPTLFADRIEPLVRPRRQRADHGPKVATLRRRAAVVRTVRKILEGEGFTEVTTPVMGRTYNGGTARPFVTEREGQPMYLRVAPEPNLLRLMSMDSGRIFEIGPAFRNEGSGRRHMPEFTTLEFNAPFQTREEAMLLVGRIVNRTRRAAGRKPLKFKEASFFDLLQQATGIDCLEASEAALRAVGGEGGSRADMLDDLFARLVEPHLPGAVFVTDMPAEFSPLAGRGSDERLTDRFELYIDGMELANGFAQITDAALQRRLLEEQAAADGRTLDDDLLEAIDEGMPPNFGVGIGIDRLVMVALEEPDIRTVAAFPVR